MGSVPPFAMWMICLLALSAAFAESETPQAIPNAPSQWNACIECRFVALPEQIAIPLITKSDDLAKGPEIWNDVEALLNSGEATLTAEMATTVSASISALSKTETGITAIYPIAYESLLPRTPMVLTKDVATKLLEAWPTKGACAAHFEERDAGDSIEFKASVPKDGTWIDVMLTAKQCRFGTWDRFDYGELPNGERISVSRPTFDTKEDTFAWHCRSGESFLFGVHRAADSQEHLELFLMRVFARKVEARDPQSRP